MSSISVRIGFTLSIGLLLLAGACTDARKGGAIFDSKTGKHPDNWVADHPAVFLSDASQCTECHGSDLKGGISGVSCYSASFNGVSCHPNGPSGHPAGWNDPTQHGASAKAAPSSSTGFASCELCHGADFSGGFAPTCLNTAGCHGAGVDSPHAFPWQSTSTRKHSTTDPGNAPVCGLCHLADRQPPAYAPLTVPVGCFDNTLCHGQVGHAVGWANPDTHGAAAKSAPSATAMQGFSTCQTCHGANFAGSTATTCLNTAGCHGAGVDSPHAFPWQSTSTRKHSTTNVANATACGLCHLANRQPPSYVVLTVPVGCFDNTLCHGQVGHAAGWANPDSHGAAAKSAPSATAMQGFSTCQTCHGANFAGGTATTCLNTVGCHGATVDSPHAFPWQSTSTRKHSTTDVANASSCGLCHLGNVQPPTYAPLTVPVGCFDGTLCHTSATMGCVDCHDVAISCPTAQSIDASVTQRRAIVPEFQQTWSHKRSAGGIVTNQDCAVCHMEGNVSDGSRNLTYHGNGYIELRDPDTGSTIKQATWSNSPAGAGSYASGATDARFVRFSRNLATDLVSDANYATLGGIMINQCLKCHDANGAISTSARVPTTGTAEKPFGTTIAGAGYTGAGVTANGVLGGVTDINAAFATTNSSYHPVRGKQNNWYAKLTRMVAPWNAATRGGTVDTTSWGHLISCWDCHALSTDTGTITRTVTGHGAAATVRGVATVTGTPAATTNQVTFCIVCHAGYDSNTSSHHGSGSALASSTNGGMTPYLRYGCNYCHSSSINAVRPTRAENVHGVNRLPGTGTDARWPTGATETSRPYAFIRNTATPLSLSNHRPLTAAGEITTGSAQCSAPGTTSPCDDNMGTYTPGGVY